MLTEKIDGPSNGFINQNYYFFTVIIRKYFLPVIYIYVLLLPIFCIFFKFNSLFFNEKFNFKKYGYLLSSAMIMTGTVSFLKSFWGRSRPKEIIDLPDKSGQEIKELKITTASLRKQLAKFKNDKAKSIYFWKVSPLCIKVICNTHTVIIL